MHLFYFPISDEASCYLNFFFLHLENFANQPSNCVLSHFHMFFSFLKYWCGFTLSTVCTSGLHSVKRMLRSLEACRAVQHSWKGWKPHPMRSAWGHWVCLEKRRLRDNLTGFYNFMSRRSGKGSVGLPSLVTNGRRHKTAQSCARGVPTEHEEKHLYWEGGQTQTSFPRVDVPRLLALKEFKQCFQ